jgi:transposase-like protein
MDIPKTLLEAIAYFQDAENCRKFMVEIRWADGVAHCPYCDSTKLTWLAKANVYRCYGNHAKQKFSLKVGTIFEDSPITLSKWLPAAWLLSNCKNGISSYELARALGVTQKSAWHMLHRLRTAMTDNGMALEGTIEMDETFVGGKAKNMHKSKRAKLGSHLASPGTFKGKTVVVGMLERGGRVKAGVVAERNKETLLNLAHTEIAAGSTVITDELHAYKGMDHAHEVVNHAIEYARGHIHTNGIESFWSMLKRSLHGTYISVEPFHLDAYVAEQVFRYNNRKDADDFARFATCIMGIQGKRLTYAKLTDQERRRQLLN